MVIYNGTLYHGACMTGYEQYYGTTDDTMVCV